jgi:uncharacterized protein YbjQ (UPF0145 family)
MSILEANNMRVLPNGLKDVVKSMMLRLSDSNKSITRTALGALAKLAEALGTHSKSFARQVIPGLIAALGDKQNLLRQEAMMALAKWAEEAGADQVALVSVPFLSQENPEMKGELM